MENGAAGQGWDGLTIGGWRIEASDLDCDRTANDGDGVTVTAESDRSSTFVVGAPSWP